MAEKPQTPTESNRERHLRRAVLTVQVVRCLTYLWNLLGDLVRTHL